MHRTSPIRKKSLAGHQWLTHVIPATWEAEIWRIVIGDQPRKIVLKTPFPN
jgi:hypothetical protein